MKIAVVRLFSLCASGLLTLGLASSPHAQGSTPPETKAPAAAPPAVTAPAAVPCPPGLLWHNGACVSPYPVCAPGFAFDGYYCIPTVPPPGYQEAEEARAWALRLQHRMRGKLTIDLQGGGGLVAPRNWESRTTVVAPAGVLMFGYRRNYQEQLGALFRGGFLLGIPIFDYNDPYSSSSGDDSDGTLMYGVLAEAAPFFGPFGRFYLGPSAFAGYVAFEQSDLHAGPRHFHLSDGLMFGLGLAGGVVVGDREQTDITFSFRVDLNPDHKATLFLMGGVGFHR